MDEDDDDDDEDDETEDDETEEDETEDDETEDDVDEEGFVDVSSSLVFELASTVDVLLDAEES